MLLKVVTDPVSPGSLTVNDVNPSPPVTIFSMVKTLPVFAILTDVRLGALEFPRFTVSISLKSVNVDPF